MADVFISFAEDEKQVALTLKDFITNKVGEVSIFVSADRWQIKAGERWLDRIERELRAAKIILLVVSTASVTRPWINFEAGAAWLNGATVIPVCFGELTFRTLPKPYDAFQAVALDDDDQIYVLVRSVSAAIGQLIPPLPILPQDPDLNSLKEVAARSAAPRAPASSTTVSMPNPRTFDESIISLLSEQAKVLLVEASKSKSGTIQRVDLDQALVVQINGQDFEARLENGRFRAELEGALFELEENDLISDLIGKRTLFQLTAKGYRIASKVAEAAS